MSPTAALMGASARPTRLATPQGTATAGAGGAGSSGGRGSGGEGNGGVSGAAVTLIPSHRGRRAASSAGGAGAAGVAARHRTPDPLPPTPALIAACSPAAWTDSTRPRQARAPRAMARCIVLGWGGRGSGLAGVCPAAGWHLQRARARHAPHTRPRSQHASAQPFPHTRPRSDASEGCKRRNYEECSHEHGRAVIMRTPPTPRPPAMRPPLPARTTRPASRRSVGWPPGAGRPGRPTDGGAGPAGRGGRREP